MAAWLIPTLKAVLPHVGTIVAAAAPVFTKKSSEAAANQSALVQQQITELQQAVSQNATHIRELAEQLKETVSALEQAAELAQHRVRSVMGLAVIAIGLSGLSLVAVLSVLLMSE